jgi:ABC-type antimicrobial peptide transport system permease subunit
MYETAEQILKLEGVLNMITLVAVLVLFFIILIGVVNTLRMTIRERTREIGTIRAIGMQRTDVRNAFILETLLLAFFASVAGVLLAFGAMGVLSHIPMNLEDNPMGMFLVSGRLYFIPTLSGVLGNMVLIWVLAGVTAFFPARRAANLSPGAALRHFE